MKPTDPVRPEPDTPRPAHGHGGSSDLHNEDVDHEHSDINIRAVLGFATGLVTVVVAVIFLMLLTFNGLERNAASNDPQLSPLAVAAGQEPPEPRLLTNEPANLEKVRRGEAEQLEGYGWVDQAGGVARIPIDEAKKKLIERGLPTRTEVPPDQRLGTWAPSMGESSSGRVLGSRATPNAPGAPASAPRPAADPAHKGH
jgi:hypothetical protein